MTAQQFAQIWEGPEDYVEVHTSGSTGTPKTIRLTKHDMRMSADATNAFFGLGAGARFVCPMSFDFVGARMMLVRARQCGGELDAIEPSNSFTFNGTADLLAIVPSQVDALIDAPGTARNVIIGGAPLDDTRRQRLICAGINAYTTYGMTETASHVALARVDTDVFQALPDIRFSTDNRGCLVIDMPGRDDGHIVTNDIVELISPVSFRWLGRHDNIINSGGIKINPEQVEAVASRVLSGMNIPFTALMVAPRPSQKWGTEAVLIIETTVTITDAETAELSRGLKENLPDKRTAPRQIITTSALPRTASGKISRANHSNIKTILP